MESLDKQLSSELVWNEIRSIACLSNLLVFVLATLALGGNLNRCCKLAIYIRKIFCRQVFPEIKSSYKEMVMKFKCIWMHHGVLRYTQEMIRQHNSFYYI